LDEVTIELTEEVTLVDSCTTSTGGSPPDVSSLTQDPSDPLRYTVAFDGAIEVAEWTTVTLTLENDSEVEADICFQLGHLPGDVNQDAQVSLADSTVFGDVFDAGGPNALGDLDDNGQVNLNDATKFGQIWNGTSGEGYLPDGTGGWAGQGLGDRPTCACP